MTENRLVQKFGGTSVGTPERMKSVAKLINDGKKKIVVLSAMSGVTNNLEEISGYLHKKNYETAHESINHLASHHFSFINELFVKESYKKESLDIVKKIFTDLRTMVGKPFSEREEKLILAQGETLSTELFTLVLKELGINCLLISALDFIKTNQNEEPDYDFIKEKLNILLQRNEHYDVIITQGFICKDIEGGVSNLKRGGSDYTASIIGVVTEAPEIQIWTDIDGMHNNDPRIVENTHSIHNLSFNEAAELAYFGAKILHPSSILPAKFANIPVVLKNTMDSDAEGTAISSNELRSGIKAIAAKDGITMIKIKSGRMLLAYGFLHTIFDIFKKYKTPIDMVTTSEVGVSVTIDNKSHLVPICDELKKLGSVFVKENQSIICMVGYMIGEDRNVLAKIFNSLQNFTIRMISYGGSLHNLSILIDESEKKAVLNALNKGLF